MKKTLIALVALSGLAVASAATTVDLNLPTTIEKATESSNVAPNIANFVNIGFGSVLVGYNNGGSVGDYGSNGEGAWTNTNNVGTITLCGRGGKDGDYMVLVLGEEIQKDTAFTGVTFAAGDISVNDTSLTMRPYTLTVALWDGTQILSEETADAGAKSVQLTFTEPQVWGDNYKVIALLKGGTNLNGSNGLSYNVGGIKAYITTPEPATATLSLLALAGLASRRRRH